MSISRDNLFRGIGKPSMFRDGCCNVRNGKHRCGREKSHKGLHWCGSIDGKINDSCKFTWKRKSVK